jgi:glutamine amidotransferase-like uncharacterized protein
LRTIGRPTGVGLSAFLILLIVAIPSPLSVTVQMGLADGGMGCSPADTRTDLSGIKVAVYVGTSLSGVVASKDALVHMYEWMNATVDVVNETEIQDGILDANGYEILAFPGGNPVTYNNRLSSNGRAAIKGWVGRGGSYFGICGGAMLACRVVAFSGGHTYYPLVLFNGSACGPIGTIGGMVTLHMNTSCTGPDLSSIPATLESNYQGGGYYVPDEGQEMITLATYDYNSEAGLVASTFGTGTVCLSATHVELEENSDRDGTSYYDSLDDPDSEWDLMLQISLWQIEASTWTEAPTTTTTDTDTSTTGTTNDTTLVDDPLSSLIPVLAVTGVVAVVVIVGVFVKRR